MRCALEKLKAVVKVGSGRGFIVGAGYHRLVITAGHCLPHFPPCDPTSYTQERTYANLLGALGNGKPKVWAECLFVDPIADVAVLGSPDDQSLSAEAEAYELLMEEVPILPIGKAPRKAQAWILTLDCRWVRCSVKHCNGALQIEDVAEGIHGGMSGSPILSDDGVAIGVVCTPAGDTDEPSGPNPRLTHCLPGWLLDHVKEEQP